VHRPCLFPALYPNNCHMRSAWFHLQWRSSCYTAIKYWHTFGHQIPSDGILVHTCTLYSLRSHAGTHVSVPHRVEHGEHADIRTSRPQAPCRACILHWCFPLTSDPVKLQFGQAQAASAACPAQQLRRAVCRRLQNLVHVLCAQMHVDRGRARSRSEQAQSGLAAGQRCWHPERDGGSWTAEDCSASPRASVCM
jgi:hypothetical protein